MHLASSVALLQLLCLVYANQKGCHCLFDVKGLRVGIFMSLDSACMLYVSALLEFRCSPVIDLVKRLSIVYVPPICLSFLHLVCFVSGRIVAIKKTCHSNVLPLSLVRVSVES
jgi:hypothetical protein